LPHLDLWRSDAPHHRSRRQAGAADAPGPGSADADSDRIAEDGMTRTPPVPSLGRKLLPYLWPHRLRFGWALLQVFLIAGVELFKPWPLQIVIDHVLG